MPSCPHLVPSYTVVCWGSCPKDSGIGIGASGWTIVENRVNAKLQSRTKAKVHPEKHRTPYRSLRTLQQTNSGDETCM